MMLLLLFFTADNHCYEKVVDESCVGVVQYVYLAVCLRMFIHFHPLKYYMCALCGSVLLLLHLTDLSLYMYCFV